MSALLPSRCFYFRSGPLGLAREQIPVPPGGVRFRSVGLGMCQGRRLGRNRRNELLRLSVWVSSDLRPLSERHREEN